MTRHWKYADARVFNKISYSQFEDIYLSPGVFIVWRKWGEMSAGPDLREEFKSLDISSQKRKQRKKRAEIIYICRSVTFLDHGNRNVTVRSEEKERDFFSLPEEAVGRVSWNRVNQRKRGTDRNRIGRCFRGSCRGEIKRGRWPIIGRKGRTRFWMQLSQAALKGEPATTAAFRQDRKYAEFMDARVPPGRVGMASYVRPSCRVVPFSLTVYTYASPRCRWTRLVN